MRTKSEGGGGERNKNADFKPPSRVSSESNNAATAGSATAGRPKSQPRPQRVQADPTSSEDNTSSSSDDTDKNDTGSGQRAPLKLPPPQVNQTLRT